LRFDYRGMGDSEGAQQSFTETNADIRAAVDAFMQAMPELQRIVLFGLCDAASAALMYAGSDARVGGLILANPWVRTERGAAKAYLRHYYLDRLFKSGFWRKLFGGRLNVMRAVGGFLTNLRAAHGQQPAVDGNEMQVPFQQRMLKGLEGFAGPVLILLSGRDLTAQEFTDSCAASAPWSRALARANASVHAIPEADHTFSVRTVLEKAHLYCACWLREVYPSAADPQRTYQPIR